MLQRRAEFGSLCKPKTTNPNTFSLLRVSFKGLWGQGNQLQDAFSGVNTHCWQQLLLLLLLKKLFQKAWIFANTARTIQSKFSYSLKFKVHRVTNCKQPCSFESIEVIYLVILKQICKKVSCALKIISSSSATDNTSEEPEHLVYWLGALACNLSYKTHVSSQC